MLLNIFVAQTFVKILHMYIFHSFFHVTELEINRDKKVFPVLLYLFVLSIIVETNDSYNYIDIMFTFRKFCTLLETANSMLRSKLTCTS